MGKDLHFCWLKSKLVFVKKNYGVPTRYFGKTFYYLLKPFKPLLCCAFHRKAVNIKNI